MNSSVARSRLASIIGLVALAALSACSAFSQTVTPQRHDRIHSAVPIGTMADEAEANLNGLGFNCIRRSGDFPDEIGSDVHAKGFLDCTQRANSISFNCENRDQVYVALAGGARGSVEVVDHVSVVRGPDCAPVEVPKLVK